MKKWLKISLWSLFSIAILCLLSMVTQTQNVVPVQKPIIVVHSSGEDLLMNKDELLIRIERSEFFKPNMPWSQLKIAEIEKMVLKMPEVKSAKVFSDVGKSWTIEVTMRRPIIRIFNKYDESYYLDEDGKIMPITNNVARVMIASGDITERYKAISISEIINNDSLKSIHKLDDIYRISDYVCHDPFLQAQMTQLYLQKNGDFVLVPMVGGQKIVFGTANTKKEVEDKFNKLKIFYKEGIPYEGWNKYDEINLKYEGQIVCKQKE